VNFVQKTVLSAFLLVAPLIYFIYQSSVAIDKQFQKNMTSSQNISVNENIEVLTDFSLALGSVYTYTFIIGICLFLAVLWKLFKIILLKYQSAEIYNKVGNIKAEKEINEHSEKYAFHDFKKKKKMNERLKKGGLN